MMIRVLNTLRQYEKVPKHLDDNDIIPSVGRIPSIISSFRHPRRRALSVGPQSMADAYETMELIRRQRENTGSTINNMCSIPKETETLLDWGTEHHMVTNRKTVALLQKNHANSCAGTGVNSSQDLPLQ